MKKGITIWIDLNNSPHVPLFYPIVRELNRMGCKVLLTARDCFQVCELADLYGLNYKRVGIHYGKNKFLKTIGIFIRSFQLLLILINNRPSIALSHGSRSQRLASFIAGIPSVVLADYEHAAWFPIKPEKLFLPQVIPDEVLKGRIKIERVFRYPGIKEDIYLPDFSPNDNIIEQLAIDPLKIIVTVRPPAAEAHYQVPESEHFYLTTVDFLQQDSKVTIVILPRTKQQVRQAEERWSQAIKEHRVVIPSHVINGLDMIYFSDLVISGGGTMNREAASLGVPVYSIFKGKLGAVDEFLVEANRLNLIQNLKDISHIPLKKRNKKLSGKRSLRVRRMIVNEIISFAKASQETS